MLVAAITVAATTLPVSWLDAKKIVNWNTRATLTLPMRPGAPDPELAKGGRCVSTLRPASSPEDKALVAHGWKIVGPYQRFGATSVVSAEAGADGMCRPAGYQSFVFVNGVFAGTLSPKTMNSREDSAISGLSISLYDADDFAVDFMRYTPDDPLCCPTSTTNVTYAIQTLNGHKRVVPMSATTQKNPTQ
jgi:hypothetical protein